MYEINMNLVVRTDERCFFDTLKFRVLQFNATGYEVLVRLQDAAFSVQEFLVACRGLGVSEAAAQAFWTKCLEHAVVVQRRPADAPVPRLQPQS